MGGGSGNACSPGYGQAGQAGRGKGWGERLAWLQAWMVAGMQACVQEGAWTLLRAQSSHLDLPSIKPAGPPAVLTLLRLLLFGSSSAPPPSPATPKPCRCAAGDSASAEAARPRASGRLMRAAGRQKGRQGGREAGRQCCVCKAENAESEAAAQTRPVNQLAAHSHPPTHLRAACGRQTGCCGTAVGCLPRR